MPKVTIVKPSAQKESESVLANIAAAMERIIETELGTKVKVTLFREEKIEIKEAVG